MHITSNDLNSDERLAQLKEFLKDTLNIVPNPEGDGFIYISGPLKGKKFDPSSLSTSADDNDEIPLTPDEKSPD